MLVRKSKMADRNVNKLGANVYFLKNTYFIKIYGFFCLNLSFLDSKLIKLSYKNTKKPCF